ncbi:hypothetical protein [Pseudosulfitobacter sp. SM2401]|uniref:hypothetical protein n=1 Tax=Pseudosulfitobacter sp. SM2401 TaxID=3350098 RepID=UPI0036F3E727
MNDYVATIRSRRQMSLSETTEFASIIYSYGAVKGTLAQITDRVLKVDAICYVRMGNRMVATAALKQPANSYRKKLESETKANVSEADFPLEMGYVVVVEGHRGEKLPEKGRLSDMVMAKVMTQAKGRGVFATTKIEVFVETALPALGFGVVGKYQNATKQTIHVLTKGTLR